MKYDLVGVDGNAFNVMGYVVSAMKDCGLGKDEQYTYQVDAMSGDYNHLLCVSCEMIKKCNEIASKNNCEDRTCGFETEFVRIELQKESCGWQVREVGMMAENEHDCILRFESLDEARSFYDGLRNMLVQEIIKEW